MRKRHFDDITPDHSWKNDMLEETRKTNELLEGILAAVTKQPAEQVETAEIIDETPKAERPKRKNSSRV